MQDCWGGHSICSVALQVITLRSSIEQHLSIPQPSPRNQDLSIPSAFPEHAAGMKALAEAPVCGEGRAVGDEGEWRVGVEFAAEEVVPSTFQPRFPLTYVSASPSRILYFAPSQVLLSLHPKPQPPTQVSFNQGIEASPPLPLVSPSPSSRRFPSVYTLNLQTPHRNAGALLPLERGKRQVGAASSHQAPSDYCPGAPPYPMSVPNSWFQLSSPVSDA